MTVQVSSPSRPGVGVQTHVPWGRRPHPRAAPPRGPPPSGGHVTCPDGLFQAGAPLPLQEALVVARVPVHPGLGSAHPHPDTGPVLQRDALADVALH